MRARPTARAQGWGGGAMTSLERRRRQRGQRRRRGAAAASVLFCGAGGCVGIAAPGNTGPAPWASASASASSPSGSGATASARPTTWPLPYGSLYTRLPPAGTDGGPTRPCARRLDWGTSTAPSPGRLREGGIECTDVRAVRYPTCTAEQVARAKRLEVAVGPGHGPVDTDWTPHSFRGYVRRDSWSAQFEVWELRLESLAPDGTCTEIGISDWPGGSDLPPPERYGEITNSLCRSDSGLACCASTLVDEDIEVVYETGLSPGQMCVVSPMAPQGTVGQFRRGADARFAGKSRYGVGFK